MSGLLIFVASMGEVLKNMKNLQEKYVNHLQ